MYLSHKTLEEFIEKPKRISPRDLAELLTMSVMEIESIRSEAEKLDKVLVGLVTEVSIHPNADKLKLAKVDIGSKKVEIVCGGVNLVKGMKVAIALPGALVRWHGEGEFAPLESATIRGVQSNGMACAAAELGLSDDNEPEHGIMDLSALKAKPGTALAEALGRNDLVIEVDNKSITHRPDLWGHIGVARELAALWNTKLKVPKLAGIKSGNKGLSVEIKNSDLCSRYLGVVLSGIKVAPSPAWLKNKVEALGMRSINNVVDAANFVMLETGQPLHTFDLKKLASAKIIIRKAKSGESIKTLDGISRKLSGEALVIADVKGPVALAGIMGGESSEVSSSTESLVVESANFNAVNIRQTATRLGLRTEASARFEKALDPELAELAIRRFVAVMQDVASGVKVGSDLIDKYSKKSKPVTINIMPDWINNRLGTEIKNGEIKKILENLGFKITGSKVWSVVVPSWRATRDVAIKEDLLEEVARIYGYDKIPSRLPKFEVAPPVRNEAEELRMKIREILIGAGWTETLSYSFFRLGQQSDKAIELVNPTDQSKRWLRTTIYDTLHEQFSIARRADEGKEIKLFEIGRVFIDEQGEWPRDKSGKNKLPSQPWHIALAVFDIKGDSLGCIRGVLKLLSESLGIVDLPSTKPHVLGGGGVAVEVNLDNIKLPLAVKMVDPLPKYPSIVRDLSVIVPQGVVWAGIEEQIRQASPLVKQVEVFDIYQAKRSIAFHIIFRDSERTLTSDEVDGLITKIKQTLIKKFNIEVRDH